MTTAKCSVCGYVFIDAENKEPCPHCGSKRRIFEVTLTGSLSFQTSLRARLKRLGFRGFVVQLVKRVKLSRHGIPAREELRIDRSDLTRTVKKHYVEELHNGEWVTVHDEIEEWPAKRR